MKQKPKFWVSLVTGNKFPYYEYINHGWGEDIIKKGRRDLPNEYPYTIEYAPAQIPVWMKLDQ